MVIQCIHTETVTSTIEKLPHFTASAHVKRGMCDAEKRDNFQTLKIRSLIGKRQKFLFTNVPSRVLVVITVLLNSSKG